MPDLGVFQPDTRTLRNSLLLGIVVDTFLEEVGQLLPRVIIDEQFFVMHAHLLPLGIAHIRRDSIGVKQPAA